MFHFVSTVDLGNVMPSFNEEAVKNEPMLIELHPESGAGTRRSNNQRLS